MIYEHKIRMYYTDCIRNCCTRKFHS